MKGVRQYIVIAFCLLLFSSTVADPQQLSEYDVKAAFLYNFAKFIEWPDSVQKTADTLSIGIYGANPFGDKLESIVSGKTIQKRGIKVEYLSSIEGVEKQDILFWSHSSKRDTELILEATEGLPILTVSDIDEFVQKGGIIGFFFEDRQIRFEINQKAAEECGLNISSKLLRLARINDK